RVRCRPGNAAPQAGIGRHHLVRPGNGSSVNEVVFDPDNPPSAAGGADTVAYRADSTRKR
ncbi:MAG TPA: hypothetical protein VFY56_14785, partial [Propionibacteriaceae bacterium]|nr:hypothetical protein [Propionibacteriaceae bacterium]